MISDNLLLQKIGTINFGEIRIENKNHHKEHTWEHNFEIILLQKFPNRLDYIFRIKFYT